MTLDQTKNVLPGCCVALSLAQLMPQNLNGFQAPVAMTFHALPLMFLPSNVPSVWKPIGRVAT